MTQEQKDLLLKDLCARLPYGVVIQEKCVEQDETFLPNREGDRLVNIDAHADILMTNCGSWYYLDEIKPYLFPLSSMTEEQKEFVKNKFCYDWDIDEHPYSLWTYCIGIGDVDELIDWFHKNHFDYRGLIPMGLAINATGLNIY